MMKLIVLTGLATEAKTRLTLQLAQVLTDAGVRLTLLDNNDRRISLDRVPTIRLPPGCACCSVAGPLIRVLRQVETTVVLLTVSAQANPAMLDLVLDRVRGPDWTINRLALIDERTRTRQPYVAEQLRLYADAVVAEIYDIEAVLRTLNVGAELDEGVV